MFDLKEDFTNIFHFLLKSAQLMVLNMFLRVKFRTMLGGLNPRPGLNLRVKSSSWRTADYCPLVANLLHVTVGGWFSESN